jgi:hypothetical protein
MRLSVCFPNIHPIYLGERSNINNHSPRRHVQIATQPLIVAKVGLQSRPPPSRNGKPFKSFIEVMNYIITHEGPTGLFKGIGPQILKGLLVQGFLMMTKERMELAFVLLFRYVRKVRAEQLAKLQKLAAEKVAVAAEKTKIAAEKVAA